jgi:hypothetical protein
MTQGGFETGADYVAARVSFDIDSGGVSSLKELSEELGKFRTSTEAATRTGADFIKYLQQMTQMATQAAEAQTNLINQLQRMADVQQSLLSGQGTQVTRGNPQGYLNPTSGMGGSGGGAGNGMAQRPATIAGADSYLGGMSQQDPRQYLNMSHTRGTISKGDLPAASPSDNDLAQHAERHHARERAQNDQSLATGDPFSSAQRRISGLTTGASQILNEIGPGGNEQSMVGLAQKGLMSLSGMLRKSGEAKPTISDSSVPQTDAASGGVGGLGALLARGAGMGLGAAGVGLAAAGSGMYLMQEGGQAVQGVRNLGQQRGGGFQEGLGYEMAIRSMALNPFITTEQARQIVSQGLSSGYTGKEFDTVTQFMSQNLQDMNIQAAESMKMFKKNVTEGGMSSTGLSSDLGILQGASQTGYKSSQEMYGGYAATSSALISAGMSGPEASKFATTTTLMFKEDADLKDIMGQVAEASSGNTKIGAMLMNPSMSGVRLPQGTTPQTAIKRLGNNPQGLLNILRTMARQYAGKGDAGLVGFQLWLKSTFPNIGDFNDLTVVEMLMKKLLGPDNAVSNANKEEKIQTDKMTDYKNVNGFRTGLAAVTKGVEMGASAIGDFFGNLLKDPTEDWDWNNTQEKYNEGRLAGASVRSPQIDILARQSAANHTKLQVGANGNWEEFDPANAAMVKALTAGTARVRPMGDQGSGMTLRETTDGSKNLFPGGHGGGDQHVNVGGELTIRIDRDGNITSPQQGDRVGLTQNQIAANEAHGGATHNYPPPGDR